MCRLCTGMCFWLKYVPCRHPRLSYRPADTSSSMAAFTSVQLAHFACCLGTRTCAPYQTTSRQRRESGASWHSVARKRAPARRADATRPRALTTRRCVRALRVAFDCAIELAPARAAEASSTTWCTRIFRALCQLQPGEDVPRRTAARLARSGGVGGAASREDMTGAIRPGLARG